MYVSAGIIFFIESAYLQFQGCTVELFLTFFNGNLFYTSNPFCSASFHSILYLFIEILFRSYTEELDCPGFPEREEKAQCHALTTQFSSWRDTFTVFLGHLALPVDSIGDPFVWISEALGRILILCAEKVMAESLFLFTIAICKSLPCYSLIPSGHASQHLSELVHPLERISFLYALNSLPSCSF